MATSSDVPGRLPVAVNGHVFMADPPRRATVPVIRQQADTSTEAGEQSLNPQGLWRRSQESWHHGAGQDFRDGKKGDEPTDPHRFRTSKGVDCWTRGQLSLLNDTINVWPSTNTNLAVVTAGSDSQPYTVIADGTEVYFTAHPGNLLSYVNSSFETGVGTWTAGAGTTIATSTAYSPYGAQSLAITSNGSTTPSASTPTGTSGIPVSPGRNYSFTAAYATAATARTWTFTGSWYASDGAFISSSTITTGADTVAGTFLSSGFLAPANAAYLSLAAQINSTASTGEVHYLDALSIYPSINVVVNSAWRSADIQAGQAAQTVQSLATNGTYVWAALGTSGLHRNIAGAESSTADAPAAPAGGQIHLVGYANGFLLAAGSATSTAGKNTLWLVNNPLGTPSLSVIKTHDNPSFQWAGIASGRNVVYAWGNSGATGEIYKIVFDPNTGTLASAASMASYLPEGETIHALAFYAGGIILGTGKGLRIGQADGAGNIDYGPLITTPYVVRCLEPQDRWCWFGYSRFDGTSGGLGRVDLGFLTDTLTPAWASDLMAVSQNEVLSAATWTYRWTGGTTLAVLDKRVFAVSGVGIFAEDTSRKVASGTLETGTVRFSTSEPKLTRSMDVRHHALPAGASVTVQMQLEESGSWTSVGSSSTAGSYGPALDLLNQEAEAMEFRFTLARATAVGDGAELTRWTAKVLPLPSTIDEVFEIPLLMRSEVQTNTGDGYPHKIDVEAEVAYLKSLERTRALIDLQIGSETIANCFVTGSDFRGDTWSEANDHVEGVYILNVSTAHG